MCCCGKIFLTTIISHTDLLASQLERAFKIVRANPSLYKTDKGKGSSSQKSSGKPGSENTFSEQHWGSTTASFSKSVVKRDDLTLQDIVRSASGLLQPEDDDDSLDEGAELQESTTEEIDTRALMCKSTTEVILSC